MIINDLIILGRAVPEFLKDGRVTVCLGGYSPTYGYVRIYPTSYKSPIKRWDIVSVEVGKDTRDTRKESYKIVGSNSDYDNLHKKIICLGSFHKKNRPILISELATNCVSEINKARNSLGLVKPKIYANYFRHNKKSDEPYNLVMPFIAESVSTKRDFEYEPRVEYKCLPDCFASNLHKQQVLEWGFYRWMEKNPDKIDQAWDNVGLNKNNYDVYFFVGNQARYRNSFMVISILRFKKQSDYRQMPMPIFASH